MIYLDTHVLIWLHAGFVEELSLTAIAAIEENQLVLPGMAELEMVFLHEIGRMLPSAEEVVLDLAADIGLRRSNVALSAVAREAAQLSWTRDPFDRMICAEALAAGAKLLTRDRNIIANCESALW